MESPQHLAPPASVLPPTHSTALVPPPPPHPITAGPATTRAPDMGTQRTGDTLGLMAFHGVLREELSIV